MYCNSNPCIHTFKLNNKYCISKVVTWIMTVSIDFKMFSHLFSCRKKKWGWRSYSEKWNHSETWSHFRTDESPNLRSRWPKWRSKVLLPVWVTMSVFKELHFRGPVTAKQMQFKKSFLLMFFLWLRLEATFLYGCFQLSSPEHLLANRKKKRMDFALFFSWFCVIIFISILDF